MGAELEDSAALSESEVTLFAFKVCMQLKYKRF